MNKCNFVVVFSDADGVNDVIGCTTIEEAEVIVRNEFEETEKEMEEEELDADGRCEENEYGYLFGFIQVDGEINKWEIFPVKKPRRNILKK